MDSSRSRGRKRLALVAQKFNDARASGGKFGVIGSNHTTNEENFYLQKFAREGLGTSNIDHHRTGDVATLLDALSGKTNALATVGDLYTAKAVLISPMIFRSSTRCSPSRCAPTSAITTR
jgi:predicted molibdopterin-dependent oxidoreductase YjgC